MLSDKRLLFGAALLCALLALHAAGLGNYLTLEALKAGQGTFAAWRESNQFLSGLTFFAVYVIAAAASIPGAVILTLAAGALFGLGWGLLIVSFASSLGATAAFLMSRWLLRDWVRQRLGERAKSLLDGFEAEGAYYLFTARLIPVFPFFAVNLAMGLTSIRVWSFYWVSQVGMLAATLVYVNAGTQLAQIQSPSDVISFGLLGSLALLGLLPLATKRAVSVIRTHAVYRRWRKPARFDRNVVVIGGGSAGLVTAYISAALRANVTLIEKHKLGGDCLNTGCVPSKALLRSAKFVATTKRATEFGMKSATAEFEFPDVMERVKRVIRTIEPHDSAKRYRELGVDVIEGSARIISPWEVEVSLPDGMKKVLTTRSIVIATGARPTVPNLPGIELIRPLTSDTVWDIDSLPRRLVVLGGGPIGCELSQSFARLGSAVTQVEQAPRLMVREDADASELVTARLEHDGVRVLTGHAARRIEVIGDCKTLVLESNGTEVRVEFDELLIAVGRTANIKGFGLEELGVEVGRTVAVNGFLQTNFPNIYAAGDVAGPYQFTHTAAHQAWYASVNALLRPFISFRADYRVIPWATFTEPEVARVGLNEQEAIERGIAFEVTKFGIDDLDRAIADEEAHGFVKVITARGKDRILGVTIVGDHAGDLIAEFVLAMKHGLGLNKVLGTIHIYPTLAEANKYAAGSWKREHAPRRLLELVKRFHDWRLG